jgi:hypothetical protein
MTEIHTKLTATKDTPNPSNPMTGPVPFLSERNPDGNFNNENANTFFTGDQANQQTVTSSVINAPDDAAGTSAVSPPPSRPGPEPDTTPGEAFETNIGMRAAVPPLGNVPLPHGIPFYNGQPNAMPADELARWADAYKKYINW